MSRPLRSLQGRLLALVMGTVILVWLVTALLTWRDVQHELGELLDGHLAQAAAVLVVQQTQEMDDEADRVDAPSLHRYAPKVAFQVFHEGRLVVRSVNAPVEPLVQADANLKSGFANVQISGVQWRVFATHGADNDVQVYVGEEAASRTSILSAVLRGTLFPMAVALPLLALVLWWAVRRSLLPLHQLGSTLAERQPAAMDGIVLDGVPREMIPMVQALNDLFVRIGVLLESERRFTADASHELRTPIAAIRAHAQVALGASDDAPRRNALRNTLLGCDRAMHLVEQLLTLSRLEVSDVPPMVRLDLTAIARQVVAETAAHAITKEQTLEFDGPTPCPVQGNEALLSILVRNLVDNAVRYCPSAATIRVSVRDMQDQVSLSVQDSGPGLAAADRARLGERFFRVTGQSEPGSGLGWSIVQRIATVHRLALNVDASCTLGGLSVSLQGRMVP